MALQEDSKEPTSFRLSKRLKEKLAKLAEATKRPQSVLVEEALEAFCEEHAWQVAAVEEGIQDMEAGRSYTTQEVLAELEKLRVAD